jgi:hypothetical protein
MNGSEENARTLKSELVEKYDSKPVLNLACIFSNPACLRVLIKYAAKDGPETFKKVMKRRDNGEFNACALAIQNNSLDCIMVSHYATRRFSWLADFHQNKNVFLQINQRNYCEQYRIPCLIYIKLTFCRNLFVEGLISLIVMLSSPTKSVPLDWPFLLTEHQEDQKFTWKTST